MGGRYAHCEEEIYIDQRPVAAQCTQPCKARVSVAHRNERERAARVDRDAIRDGERGAGAAAIGVAGRAGAGERGRRPGGEVDAANAVIARVL